MKIKTAKIFLVAAMLFVCLTSNVKAFLLPPGPITPTVDVVSDITFFMDTVTVNIQNVTAQAGAYMQTINQKAKAFVSKYTGKFTGFMGGIFKKKEKQPLPATKEIKKSKKYDIYDKESIIEAVYELFFEYPVDCTQTDKEEYKMICQAYRDLATEFYEDSIIELYASTRELEKKFDELETSIAEVEKAVKEGKNGMQAENDENAVWKNAYNVYETMNSVLKIIQEIEAMRTQYIAVQAIGSGVVQPMLPEREEDTDKNAWNEDNEEIKMATSLSFTRTISFAQILPRETEQAVEETNTQKSLNLNTEGTEETRQENSKDEIKPKYKRAAKFVPASSKLETPYASNRENLANIEKINKAQELLFEAVEVHNQAKGLSGIQEIYDSYDKAKIIYDKALEALKNSEKCAIAYFGGMYENPNKMWNGNLKDEDLGNADARKGISGWALKVFNLAKAEDTGVIAEKDDFNEISVTTDGIDGSNLNQEDKLKKQITKNSGGFKDAKKADKVNEKLRESERLAWNIGSEASKMLALDQAENGVNGKWGKARKTYPVWKDTQAYYNQYLEGKYDGIIKKLHTINTIEIALQVAEKLNEFTDSLEEREHNAESLSRLRSKITQETQSVTSGVDALISEKKKMLSAAYQQKEQKLANIARQEELLTKEIKQKQEQLNALTIQKQDTQEEKLAQEVILSGAEEKLQNLLRKKSEEAELIESDTDEFPEIEETEQLIADAREKILDASRKIADLEKQISALTTQMKPQKKQLEKDIPALIENINSEYVATTNKITVEYDDKIQKEENKYRKINEKLYNLNLGEYFSSNFKVPSRIGNNMPYLLSLPTILTQASGLVADAKSVAEEIVKDTLDNLYAMGDDLYNPKKHDQITEKHRELMDKLKELPVKELVEYSSTIERYSSYKGVMNLLQTVYQKYVVEEACLYEYCYIADNEYFVSNNGKQRDFRAPKMVPDEPLPSLRETLFFDYGTYDNIPRDKSGHVTAEGFLKNLPYVPEIWKYILSSPAYVEKEIDLSTIIIPSVDRLAGGGIFPCLYGNYLVTSAGEKYRIYTTTASTLNWENRMNENKILANILKEGYHQCRDIEIKASGKYLTVKNIADNVSGTAEIKSLTEFKHSENKSELGHLLEYNKGLKYNALANKLFPRLSKIAKDEDANATQKDILFDIASLHQNQIGDFLKRADYEQQSKQNKQELLIERENAQTTLFETFEKIGFKPADDFNLSNVKDYTLAHNTLMRYRNKLIVEATSEISSLQENDNDVIMRRVTKLNNLIAALQKDDDAYTVFSNDTVYDAELEEKIKTEKTNRQVSSKYKEEADKDFERQLSQIGNVYCSEMVGNF